MNNTNNFKLELRTSECLVLAGHQFYSKTKKDDNGNPVKYNTIDFYTGFSRREGNYNLIAFTTFCEDDIYDIFVKYGAGFYNLIFDGSGHLVDADFVSDIVRNQ